MTRALRIAVSALALVLLGAPPSAAQAGAQVASNATQADADAALSEARAFVSGLIRDLGAAARSQPVSAREAKVRQILSEALATRRISAFLLGARRAAATPAQLREYEALAPRVIANQFGGQIDALVTQTLTVRSATARGTREVIVRADFKRARDGSTIATDWRVIRGADGKLQLLDVYVNGISPLVAKREEFGSIVSRQGFAALLEFMREDAA